MKVYLGADHRGFEMKEQLKVWLAQEEYDVEDVGAFELVAEDDYVDYASVLVKQMDVGEDRGVLLCGSGHGVDMVANRHRGVRAILGFREEVVVQGREHEDANVLCIPAEWVSLEEAQAMVLAFLKTDFSNKERYVRRLQKLESLG